MGRIRRPHMDGSMGTNRSLMAPLAAVALMAAFLGAGASAAQAPGGGLRMLSQLERGRWEIRVRGERSVQNLCIGDQLRLIQLRHQDLPCERLVLEDNASSVTVQYICRGHGYGRTRIRRESAQLVQVESQGIAEGLPFEISAEGRRAGGCGS